MMGAAGAGGAVGYTLWAWGDGQQGILGTGTAGVINNSPVQVGSESYWLGRDPEDEKKSKLSYAPAFAITNEGKLFTWGPGGDGRKGDGTTSNTCSPVQIGSLEDWDNVAAWDAGGSAVKTDGTLWTWGDGQFGALGDGTTVDKSSPVQVGSLTDWDRVYAGRQHTFGIKTDGTLWVWGFNQYGGNGTGNTTYYSSPVQVGSLTNWASLGPGSEYTAAVKTDGTLWAWGRNASGQLGTGNTTDYSSPVQIGSLTDWKQVSCHVGMNSPSRGGWLAVKTDGTLWGTGTQTTTIGANTGEIGVGNTTTYSSTVQIGRLTDWKNVVSVHYASQAIKTDGTMWTWGRGYFGTGLGDNTDRSSPAQVGSDTTWQQVGTTAANTTYFGLKDAQYVPAFFIQYAKVWFNTSQVLAKPTP